MDSHNNNDYNVPYNDLQNTPPQNRPPQNMPPNNFPPPNAPPYGYPPNGNYPYPPAPPKNQNSNATKIVIIISVAVAVLAVMVIFMLILFGGKDEKKQQSGTASETTVATEQTTVSQTDAAVLVPDLKGLGKDEAVKRLTDLKIKVKITETETDQEKAGHVYKQVPEKDSEVKPGDEVTVYVAKAVPTTAPKPEKTTFLYCIAADFVSLREGAGGGYKELVKVRSREAMIYLNSKSGNWYYVQYGDYKGYVFGDYVSFDENAPINYTPDSTTPATSLPPSNRPNNDKDYLICIADDFVSLRTGPGTDYPEIAKIPNGDVMYNMGKKTGNWYYVRYVNQYGYVSADWVKTDYR